MISRFIPLFVLTSLLVSLKANASDSARFESWYWNYSSYNTTIEMKINPVDSEQLLFTQEIEITGRDAGRFGNSSYYISPKGFRVERDGTNVCSQMINVTDTTHRITVVAEHYDAWVTWNYMHHIYLDGSLVATWYAPEGYDVWFTGGALWADKYDYVLQFGECCNEVTVYDGAVCSGDLGSVVFKYEAEDLIPIIIQQPESQSVSGGESATFAVKAENAAEYQWYKNGTPIVGAKQKSYTINTVTGYDVGEYKVVISNGQNKVESNTVTLGISEAYRAKAEAILANGFVIGFIITDPGWGYEWTPKVRVKDADGSDAEAHCIVENGMVVGIVVDNPGRGYSEDTTVKIGSPYKYNSLSVKVTEIEITMHLNLGEKYQLESTEDHITWKKVGEPFIAEDEEVQLRLEVVDRVRYFRVHEVK